MASSRPWPFEDEDRPSGSVRPLSQADLQAILAHLGDNPGELLAGTSADRPVVAVWQVKPIVAVHGDQMPCGKVVMDGVPVVPARRLPSMLRELPAVLGPERVAVLADQARVRFHAAA
jgi:hypothetical protein